jgi:hypothetical protein
MNRLFQFIAKLVGFGRSGATVAPPSRAPGSSPALGEPQSPASDTPAPDTVEPQAPLAEAPIAEPLPPLAAESNVVFLDLGEDEDVAEEIEDESDEPDPTVGRYEELQVPILDADEIGAQRAAAEVQGLSGPHKVFPHDPAGPGSLAETLAQLEAEGRVKSRVCDDADSGFYVLYEPAAPDPKA